VSTGTYNEFLEAIKMGVNKTIFYPEDIASETGLGLHLVYRLLRSGEIKHVKAGDRYLISQANFEKWLSGEKDRLPILPTKINVDSRMRE
jgi:excisionase family DNA binding protein